MNTNLPVHEFFPNHSHIPAEYDLKPTAAVLNDPKDPPELQAYLFHGGCFPHPSITNLAFRLPSISDPKKTPKLPRKPLLV